MVMGNKSLKLFYLRCLRACLLLSVLVKQIMGEVLMQYIWLMSLKVWSKRMLWRNTATIATVSNFLIAFVKSCNSLLLRC